MKKKKKLHTQHQQMCGEQWWSESLARGSRVNLVQSNVEIRWYGNDKRNRLKPHGSEDSFLMRSYRLGRLVSSIPYIKYVNHRICRPRCYIMSIRRPSLIYQSWLRITAFLLPSKSMKFCIPQSDIKQPKLPLVRPDRMKSS